MITIENYSHWHIFLPATHLLEYSQKGKYKAVSASERIHLKVNIHRKLLAQLGEITLVARSNYWIFEPHNFSQDPKAFLGKRESLSLGYLK